MKRLIIFLFAMSAFAVPLDAQKSVTRDLRQYDDGGTADFGWNVLPNHSLLAMRLRDFIWSHLHNKQLGTIKAAHYGVEGDPEYIQIFIEPNEKHEWQVIELQEWHCCWTDAFEKPRPKPRINKQTNVWTFAARYEATYSGWSQLPATRGKAIAGDLDITPNKYVLVLKHFADGQITWEL